MTEEPPKIAKIALALSAILWIATMGYALTFLNSIEARPTNQPSTQAPDDSAKAPLVATRAQDRSAGVQHGSYLGLDAGRPRNCEHMVALSS